MKKKALILLVMILIIVTGCSKEINFDNSTNFGVISTIKTDSMVDGSPTFDQTYIFNDFDSYKEYYHQFFVVNGEIAGLEESDFESNSIILYNTLIDKEKNGNVYGIEKVRVSGKKINIHIKSSGQVKPKQESSDVYYNYSYIVKIDKDLIPKDYKIVIVQDK